MWLKKQIYYVLILILSNCSNTKKVDRVNKESNYTDAVIEVPFAGNAFVTKTSTTTTEKITEQALENWTSKDAVISCYFKINKIGNLNIAFRIKNTTANISEIKITVFGKNHTVKIKDAAKTDYFICSTFVSTVGYVKVDLQGITTDGIVFANNPSLLIGGTATEIAPIFANDKDNYYWSRRGPSCHLNYKVPKQNIQYFYNEITVPIGEDKIGSYFMANGFSDGYFGIQVNSATERRILFSVWEEENKAKTILLKKGTNVVDARFDGEGTGGQSYMQYNWKAGITYKFLTKGIPDDIGNTIYTSWFYMPEKNNWQLIASFKRQNKSTYLNGLYSFLENFIDDNGYLGRKAYYTNQWIQLSGSEDWIALYAVSFSVDATGKNKQRMDFNGGVEDGKFFLQNGGFINTEIIPGSSFTTNKYNTPPTINVENLE
jgi:hypothetical protein